MRERVVVLCHQRLERMGERVHAGGGRRARRQAHGKRRIEDDRLRRDARMADVELSMRLVVFDHAEGVRLRPGACGGRNRDDRQPGIGQLVSIIEPGNRDVVGSRQGYALGAIERGAAAKAHHHRIPELTQRPRAGGDVLGGRVRSKLGEHHDLEPALPQLGVHAPDQSACDQSDIGDHEHARASESPDEIGQVVDCAHAEDASRAGADRQPLRVQRRAQEISSRRIAASSRTAPRPGRPGTVTHPSRPTRTGSARKKSRRSTVQPGGS